MIHRGDMALPDFQRNFVCDPYTTDELIELIIRNHPAGSLLRIRNGYELLFRPRAVQRAPDLRAKKPAFLILDGQQRLTSLYQAFYGAGDHRFYLDLAGLEDGDAGLQADVAGAFPSGKNRQPAASSSLLILMWAAASLLGIWLPISLALVLVSSARTEPGPSHQPDPPGRRAVSGALW